MTACDMQRRRKGRYTVDETMSRGLRKGLPWTEQRIRAKSEQMRQWWAKKREQAREEATKP